MIEIQGLKEVQKTFKKLDEAYHSDVLKELTQRTYDKAKKKASKHTVTGLMEKSIFHRFYESKNEGIVAVNLKTAPHALFVHFGTKPHIILPKNKKALRFTGSNGRFIFAKKVHHKGYKGDPFLYEAIQETMKKLDQITNEIIKDY